MTYAFRKEPQSIENEIYFIKLEIKKIQSVLEEIITRPADNQKK
jgi:hypothetical protein